MCQHGTEGDIPDASDIFDRCCELVVDDDASLAVHLDTNRFQVQTLSVWPTADSNQDYICLKLCLRELNIVKPKNEK